MKVLDLFSGIGGFSLGLERAGFETVAFCEIDKHCQKVLKKHWPKIPIFDDVKTLDGTQLKDIDVISGGFPCQDISVAGKKQGIKDGTRSGLWFEYKRLIGEIRPSYVIIENVANLRSNGLVTVLQDLWSLGYDAEWHIISARSIGACHLRERIWIIAYPNSNTIRKQSIGKQWGKSAPISGNNGEKWNLKSSNAYSKLGLERSAEIKSSERRESSQPNSTSSAFKSPNTDNLRLWKSFATEEEKSEWWSKATFSFRSWWKIESTICRVDDGLSKGLDKARRERIKQLGNSIVPQIAELIGKEIMKWEREE